MSMCSTPIERSASATAFITAGGAPMAPRLADALDANRIGLARHIAECGRERAHVVRARHGVIHVTSGQELAAVAVVNDILHQRLADALGQTAMDLAFADHRVDGTPAIVDDGIAVDFRFAGCRIDLNFNHVTAVRIARNVAVEGATRFEPERRVDRQHRVVEPLGGFDHRQGLVGAAHAVLPF